MLGAAIMHPDRRAVIPSMPEPIVRHDGTSKNDGERHAAKRFVAKLRRDHPHLKCIITEDSLSTLKNQGYHFEHHDGHDTQNLSVVFAMLMLLAFLVDQTQQLCCTLCRAVVGEAG
jgi:hypothetical protein